VRNSHDLNGIFPAVTDATSLSRPPRRILELSINGEAWDGAVEQSALLLDVLRYQVGLTGTKRGCDMGTCGCCAVRIDGDPRLSCLTLALDCEGREIRTIEGVADGPLLSSLQREWADCGASQCGFCSPGFLMVGEALLERNPKPTEAEVREAISGNLCRCTGYVKIVEAFMRATAD
jgi:carbon-monoxide dehydrogenase small subunit